VLKPKTVAFLAGGVDACALWRFFLSYMNLSQCGYYYGFDQNAVLSHDYVAVQRLGLQSNLTAMKTLRSVDMKIIYDLDDFLWDIPEWNPHAAMLKQMAFGYTHCMKHADIVTVSTNPLRKALLKHHKRDLINLVTGREIPVVVCPNKIDMRLVAPYQQRKELIVGWAGSNTHDRDFQIVLPALRQLIVEFPQVIFEFAGWMPEELRGFPNVRFRHWTPVSEWFLRYPRWGWSIALAPLFGHEFNNSKSGNKMTEAGSIGIPCLASHELPYSDWCRTSSDRELSWMLCAGADSWYKKLKMLIQDESQRKHYGQLMYQNTVEHHSWTGGSRGWDTVLETLASM
jgi:glycosyltransferase involved in cell wall biosynthesis